jgi:hypothetical protein
MDTSTHKYLDCLVLNMKANRSFKILNTTRPTTKLHIPEDLIAQRHHRDNFKCRSKYFTLSLKFTKYFDREKCSGLINRCNTNIINVDIKIIKCY